MKALLAREGRQLLEELRRPGTLFVFDFDGTLSPIVSDRTRARMTRRTGRLLAALATTRPVAILSGRGLDDLAPRLEGVPARWLVGGHGAEWPGDARPRALLRRVAGWRRTLRRRLSAVEGIDVEDKGRSLSVHWRNAPDPAAAAVAVARAAAGLPGATLVEGKRVLSVVPDDAPDKGDALARLVAESGCARVLFIGDDVTDESAFRARLPVPAVMVRVGRDARSAASWFVRTRADVDGLVARLGGRPAPAATGAPQDREAPSDDRLGPVLAFMRTLWALEHGLSRRSWEMHRRLGVTGPQRLVLRVVSRLGPLSQGALAQVLHLNPASVTRLARALERRRLLHRLPDPHDRRRVLLELGAAGARVDRSTDRTVEGAVREALATSSRREIAVARRLVERLTDRLLG